MATATTTTTTLERISPGTRFAIPVLGITGTLIKCNPCRAEVRIDGTDRRVQIRTTDGRKADFIRPGRSGHWAPATSVEVEVIENERESEGFMDLDQAIESVEKETVEPARPDLYSPVAGEIVDRDDVDRLWEAYDEANQLAKRITTFLYEIRREFERMAPRGDTATARAQGEQHRIKVIYPSEKWDNGMLKEALNAYPETGAKYLRISEVAVIAKEVNKLRNETKPGEQSEAFEQFKSMVLDASKGCEGTARIELEK